jgi:hypothetical protein
MPSTRSQNLKRKNPPLSNKSVENEENPLKFKKYKLTTRNSSESRSNSQKKIQIGNIKVPPHLSEKSKMSTSSQYHHHHTLFPDESKTNSNGNEVPKKGPKGSSVSPMVIPKDMSPYLCICKSDLAQSTYIYIHKAQEETLTCEGFSDILVKKFKNPNQKLHTALLGTSFGLIDPSKPVAYYKDSLPLVFSNECLRIFIRTLTDKILVLHVDSTSTVSTLKAIVKDRIDTTYEDQRLLFAGKLLEDDKQTLHDVNICNNCTVIMIRKNKETTTQNDTNTSKTLRNNRTIKENDWFSAGDGINLHGTCQNNRCDAFQKDVIVQLGYGMYDVITQKHEICLCPGCHQQFNVDKCGFQNCSYMMRGMKQLKEGTEMVQWTNWKETMISTWEMFEFFTENQEDWVTLKFYVNKQKMGKCCGICGEEVLKSSREKGVKKCDHIFHAECLKQVNVGNCIFCRN